MPKIIPLPGEQTSNAEVWQIALAVTNTWERMFLCIDRLAPYILKVKEGTHMNFMSVTIIDPAVCCFPTMELPISQTSELTIPMDTIGYIGINKLKYNKQPYFDKMS